MKDLSQYLFIKDLSQYKRQSKNSKFVIAFSWLVNSLSYYFVSFKFDNLKKFQTSSTSSIAEPAKCLY